MKSKERHFEFNVSVDDQKKATCSCNEQCENLLPCSHIVFICNNHPGKIDLNAMIDPIYERKKNIDAMKPLHLIIPRVESIPVDYSINPSDFPNRKRGRPTNRKRYKFLFEKIKKGQPRCPFCHYYGHREKTCMVKLVIEKVKNKNDNFNFTKIPKSPLSVARKMLKGDGISVPKIEELFHDETTEASQSGGHDPTEEESHLNDETTVNDSENASGGFLENLRQLINNRVATENDPEVSE